MRELLVTVIQFARKQQYATGVDWEDLEWTTMPLKYESEEEAEEEIRSLELETDSLLFRTKEAA